MLVAGQAGDAARGAAVAAGRAASERMEVAVGLVGYAGPITMVGLRAPQSLALI